MSLIETLQQMLDRGQDSALLRYSLGNACWKAGDLARASEHFAEAVRQDAGYSAAWKLYGRVLTELGQLDAAIDTLTRGIEVARENGDVQAAKEMEVFLKRAKKRVAD